ncbi:hypothetical protein MUB15_19835 [Priestia sp. OVS21]|nr:hypothetical protein [Priestia sp. OVS21]
MKWTQLIAGAAVGFASAYILQKESRQFPHPKPLRLLKALLNKMGQSMAHGLKQRLKSFKNMVSLFMVIQVELSEHVMQNRNITSFSLIKKRFYY